MSLYDFFNNKKLKTFKESGIKRNKTTTTKKKERKKNK
jgi:hypothetical protein